MREKRCFVAGLAIFVGVLVILNVLQSVYDNARKEITNIRSFDAPYSLQVCDFSLVGKVH